MCMYLIPSQFVSPLSGDPHDTSEIMEYLVGVASFWQSISMYLYLSAGRINRIRINNPFNVIGCMRATVIEWLSLNYDTRTFGKPTWRDLAVSVKSSNRALFREIAKDHLMTAIQGKQHVIYCKFKYTYLHKHDLCQLVPRVLGSSLE